MDDYDWLILLIVSQSNLFLFAKCFFFSAIEKFNLTQPLNSLMVRRTTDENVSQWFERKNSAVLYFHYALILESNGRFKDAAEARQKVAELGFEIDEKLF